MTKVVTVKFPGSAKKYCYTYDGTKEVEKLDLAVVDSPYSGPTLVTVEEVRPASQSEKLGFKPVMEIVSLAEERRRKENEVKARIIEEKLNEKMQQLSKFMIYQQLATADPEAADLLKQLKELQ